MIPVYRMLNDADATNNERGKIEEFVAWMIAIPLLITIVVFLLRV